MAIAKRDPINGFLRQAVTEASTAEEADALLMQIAEAPSHDLAQQEPNPFEMAQPTPIAPGPSAIPPLHLAV